MKTLYWQAYWWVTSWYTNRWNFAKNCHLKLVEVFPDKKKSHCEHSTGYFSWWLQTAFEVDCHCRRQNFWTNSSRKMPAPLQWYQFGTGVPCTTIGLQWTKSVGESGKYCNDIHLTEKMLSLEKYKPWTMGPNGFMGRTLLALQI